MVLNAQARPNTVWAGLSGHALALRGFLVDFARRYHHCLAVHVGDGVLGQTDHIWERRAPLFSELGQGGSHIYEHLFCLDSGAAWLSGLSHDQNWQDLLRPAGFAPHLCLSGRGGSVRMSEPLASAPARRVHDQSGQEVKPRLDAVEVHVLLLRGVVAVARQAAKAATVTGLPAAAAKAASVPPPLPLSFTASVRPVSA